MPVCCTGMTTQGTPGCWYMWNDILIVACIMAEVKSVIDELVSVFDAHDLGDAHFFLSISIETDRANRTLKLSQKRLTIQLVEEYGHGDCKGKRVPLGTIVQPPKADREYLDKETYTYTHLIGSLLYCLSAQGQTSHKP